MGISVSILLLYVFQFEGEQIRLLEDIIIQEIFQAGKRKLLIICVV